jgi:hypothetical protein
MIAKKAIIDMKKLFLVTGNESIDSSVYSNAVNVPRNECSRESYINWKCITL